MCEYGPITGFQGRFGLSGSGLRCGTKADSQIIGGGFANRRELPDQNDIAFGPLG